MAGVKWLERINVFAARSVKAGDQSGRVRVNYRYDPEQVLANHEVFVLEGRIIMSKPLQREYDKHIQVER